MANAILCCENALQLGLTSNLTRARLAQMLMRRGRSDDAIVVMRAAVAIEPKSAVLHTQLGVMFAQLNRLAEAIEMLKVSAKNAPHDVEVKTLLQQLEAQVEKHSRRPK